MHLRCTWMLRGRQLALLLLLALAATTSAGDPSEAVSNSRQLETDNRDGRDGQPGRSVLADIAREMVMRSATSSQVLSLNLTNLLILLILKALLFGAGVFSFGFLKHGGHAAAGHLGRSAGDVPPAGAAASSSAALDEPELLLMLSFLLGDATRQYDCLYRVACEQPERAREYALAAKALIKGASMLGSVTAHDARYEAITAGLQKAADYGLAGKECGRRYSCQSAVDSGTDHEPAD